jgi:hypothetical protein
VALSSWQFKKMPRLIGVMTSSKGSTISNQMKFRKIIAWLPLMMWVAVFALGNFVVPIFVSEVRFRSVEGTFYSSIFGLLVVQPCLLAVWLALGNQRLVLRVSIALGILFVLACLFLIALNMVNGSMPLEVYLMCVGLGVMVMLSIAIPLWFFRVRSGGIIALADSRSTHHSINQFGIKHLLVATTVAGLMIALAQIAIPHAKFRGDAPWGEIIAFCVALNLFVVLLALLSFAFVFIPKRRLVTGIGMVSVGFLGPFPVAGFLVNFVSAFQFLETAVNTMSFGVILTLAMSLVLASFYWIGFRLQKIGNV